LSKEQEDWAKQDEERSDDAGPLNEGDDEKKNERDDDDDDNDERILEYAIDSFLSGGYDRSISEDDAPAPHPALSPGQTTEAALRSLRDLDDPEQPSSRGAAVFQRFCLPLRRAERWGDSSAAAGRDPWKEVLRGALTPGMFARRLRASEEFSGLLDWTALDVTEGAYSPPQRDLVGIPSTAFVNVALYFGDGGAEPSLIQFTLRRRAGVWLIDTAARQSHNQLFLEGTGKS
jgi:hypothetical protein